MDHWVTTMPEIPDFLNHLPVEPRRKLPVPFTNIITESGEPDFTTIDAQKTVECALLRLCGVCGKKLSYWIAFLGGPQSAESRAYLDPPMHEECARAAVKLCPFIAMPSMARRKTPLTRDSTYPEGWTADRPEVFVLYITRKFKCRVPHHDSVIFLPAPASRIEVLEETRSQ